MMEFTVRVGQRKGRYIESDNVIEFGDPYPEVDISIGFYDYGCEGDGHYLETNLPPGRYKVVPVDIMPDGET